MCGAGGAKLTSESDYYNIEEVEEVKETKKEKMLGGGITKRYEISWKHSKYGNQILRLNLYNNPQVQNGIEYKSELYKRELSSGLLVSSIVASKAELVGLRSAYGSRGGVKEMSGILKKLK